MLQCGQNFRLSKFGFFCLISLSCLFFFYVRGFSVSQLFMRNEDTISLRRLLLTSIQAAKQGGIKVKNVKVSQDLQVKSKGYTKEGANDLVTLGDMLSHKQMYYILRKEFPRLHIVSEEVSDNEPIPQQDTSSLDLDANEEVSLQLGNHYDTLVPIEDLTVWIDPLDATQEYTENLTEFVTTMVCVAVKGEAVIGVIHFPFEDKTVWAWRGNGHSSNIDYISETAPTQESHMKIIVSRSHSGKVKQIAKKVFGEDAEVISAGGAGYKSLFVVRRGANAYIHITAIKKWDICAGNALLKQLGGDMTDLNGNAISFSDKTRSNLVLKDGIVATFKKHLKIVEKIQGANIALTR